MKYLHEYAKPFYKEGNEKYKKKGCLIVHGFTGSPGHMMLLGDELNDAGFTVSGILLKGHGTSIEDMEKTDWNDWLDSTIKGYDKLKKTCDEVYIMGLSMGGVLSMIMAERYPVDKLITLDAPVRVKDKKIYLTPIIKYFMKYNYWGEEEYFDGEDKEHNIGYTGFAVKNSPHLLKLMKIAEKGFSNINCPTLVVQSKTDGTVDPISANMIYDGISSEEKEILWLERSKHVCTLGPERDFMHEKIIEFLNK